MVIELSHNPSGGVQLTGSLPVLDDIKERTDNLPDLPANEATSQSIFGDTYIIETHLHSRERWFGISPDQSGDNWGIQAELTPFQSISGNGDFGMDPNDEAKLLGTEDTPAIIGKTHFDFHRLFIDDSSSSTVYVIRIIYGTGTIDEAESAGQFTTVMYKKESAVGRGAPLDLQMPLLEAGTKVWARVKNATNNATLDFFFGLHEYTIT